MKFLQQILLAAIVVIGFSLTASAQRPEEKKKPPKENAEIKPQENKKPPKNNENRNNENRNEENKGKKPQTYFLLSENRIVVSSI